MGNNTRNTMRTYHRYLGFFLAGIMAIYALSGITLIFRNTNAFKVQNEVRKTLTPGLSEGELGQELRIRGFKSKAMEGDLMIFETGFYNTKTGEAEYYTMELPYILDKITHMHKATTESTLFYLNIFFGASLLFFVISSFWMFIPGTGVFKKGLYFTAGGILLALLMIFI
ncbi:MAG: hypothetical protein JXQ90_04610 [Cyclobacteriaceae bacterium]